MNEKLKTWTRTLLLEYCGTVKYRRAGAADKYPRAVFRYDPFIDDGMAKGVLTVKIWDNSDDSAPADRIAADILNDLSGMSYNGDDFFVFFTEGKCQSDEDDKLQALRITFNYHFIDKERLT